MDDNFNFQEAIEKVREMFSGEDGNAQLLEIIKAFRDEPEEKTEEKGEEGGFDFDPAMLLKLQKIMSLSGKSDKNDKTNLLLSLKPFLKDERKNKVDKAVQLMNISKIISVFKDDF
ncbi:MAG: hypothetical protein E7415_04180 [Ruminococcaceae bacterium]|nr:hypothetical protein [Oscillospiraceae bacterium]